MSQNATALALQEIVWSPEMQSACSTRSRRFQVISCASPQTSGLDRVRELPGTGPERAGQTLSAAGKKIKAILLELYGQPTVFPIVDSEEITPETEPEVTKPSVSKPQKLS